MESRKQLHFAFLFIALTTESAKTYMSINFLVGKAMEEALKKCISARI